MSRDTAEQICWVFSKTYRRGTDGVFRDKTGRVAPARSLEILDRALDVVGGR
jgi:hypothetical protein